MASITWGILLCAAALAAASDLDFSRSGRIVGGQETTIEKYPSIIAIEMQSPYTGVWSQGCGGSILTFTHILTAGHCLEGLFYAPQRTRFRAGSTQRNSGGSIHLLKREIKHPSYNSRISMDGDVAVVLLATPLIFSDRVQPVTVVAQDSAIPSGLPVVHAGWGHLKHNGAFPLRLQHVTIDTIDHALCVQRYRQQRLSVTKNMICAGILNAGGKDACQGDSGGPLYYGDILIGVVSWGIDCADSYYPGVSASVGSYTDWIVATAASLV